MNNLELLGNILTDRKLLEIVLANPVEVLGKEGLNEVEKQQFMQLLNFILAFSQEQERVQKFTSDQLNSTAKTSDAFKDGLMNTLKQIDFGFKSTMIMYQCTFYLGILMILAALAMAIINSSSILPIVFGSVGVLDIIGFFIKNPPRDLQKSRTELAQLQAAFFNWFTDIYNWNSYLLFLSKTNKADFEANKKISDAVLNSTKETLDMIEKYCHYGDEAKPPKIHKGQTK